MPPKYSAELVESAKKVKAILSDVDGVLTDGGISFDNNGIESKRFHVKDGLGVKLWRLNQCPFGVLTARQSRLVEIRCEELKVDVVCQGFEAKWPKAEEIIRDWNLSPEEVCYIGDDLTDLPVMEKVGLPATVADGCLEVREQSMLISQAKGGQGAVREIIETILRASNRWETTLSTYQQMNLPGQTPAEPDRSKGTAK